jgi:peptidoglycan/LPS O-acetylase OafA/YrhL
MLSESKRIHFEHLDFLRFIAAYMIVVFHMFYGWQANWGFPPLMETGAEGGGLSLWGRLAESFIHNLSLGVDLFFLISGFLITYLLLVEKETHGKIAVGKFWMRRLFRIWPLYFLIIGTGPLLTWLFDEPVPSSYLMHLVFLGNFEMIANGFSSASVNHLWSICIEEHFYLICPLIVGFVPRRFLAGAFMAIVLLSFCFRWAHVDADNYWMTFYLHTVSRMDVLAIGCLAGMGFHSGSLRFAAPREVRWGVAALLLIILTNDVYVLWDGFFLATSKKYVYILLIGYLVGDLMFNPNVRWKMPTKGFLTYLGKASYGMYMFNPVIIAVFVKMYWKYSYFNGWVFLIGIHVAVLAVVILSFELYEKPLLRLKDRFAVVRTRKY